MEEASRRSYQFWDTQPVPKLGKIKVVAWTPLIKVETHSEASSLGSSCLRFLSGETVMSHGSIEPDKDHIREEPYSLPQGFSWDTLDLGDSAVVRQRSVTPTGFLKGRS